LQFQADLLGVPVRRSRISETTALGAAYLAGLAVGYWRDLSELEAHWQLDREFLPVLRTAERDRRLAGWHKAIERVRDWAAPE
jgi:glycerol kinase